MLALDDFESANARANEDAYSLGILGRDLQARLRHRLLGRGEGVVNKAPHLARFLLVDKVERIKVFDLGGEGYRETCRVESLYRSHTAGSGQNLPPNVGGCVADAA